MVANVLSRALREIWLPRLHIDCESRLRNVHVHKRHAEQELRALLRLVRRKLASLLYDQANWYSILWSCAYGFRCWKNSFVDSESEEYLHHNVNPWCIGKFEYYDDDLDTYALMCWTFILVRPILCVTPYDRTARSMWLNLQRSYTTQ